MTNKNYLQRYLEAVQKSDSLALRWAYQKEQILQELLKRKLFFVADASQAIQEIEKLKKALESLKKGDF